MAQQQWEIALSNSRRKFNDVNLENYVNYDQEAMFAMQAIKKNDYMMKIANNNPESFRNAVINIAAIGLSLNPSTKFAYLVPRKGECCLDISYIGLIKLATDSGSISWARAELVHENDNFTYRGAPPHARFACTKPFNRGKVLGVYCESKTHEGDYLTGLMNISECHAIRDRSEAWKANKTGPWLTDEGEMMKKVIIKRESKTWPKTDRSERLDKAIHVLNEHEGIDFSEASKIKEAIEKHKHSIKVIVDSLASEQYEKAAEAFYELTNAEQQSIWIAPTKCKKMGIEPPFTTAERNFIKEQLSKYHPNKII